MPTTKFHVGDIVFAPIDIKYCEYVVTGVMGDSITVEGEYAWGNYWYKAEIFVLKEHQKLSHLPDWL